MKKFLFLMFFLSFWILANCGDVCAQNYKKRARLKKKNKNIANFRGGGMSTSKSKQYIAIGGSINALNYFGDLAPKSNAASTDISFTRPGLGIIASFRLNPFNSVNVQFMYGRLQGSDFTSANPEGELSKYRYVRNLHFRNDIKELSVNWALDLLPNHGTFMTRLPLTPYVTLGAAVFHHDPKAKVPEYDNIHQYTAAQIQSGELPEPHPDAGKWVRLKPLGTEGQYQEDSGVKPYSNFQFAIPIGFGLRFKVSRHLDLSVEIAYRHLFFDHIDDVGGKYVDLGSFPESANGDLARTMADPSRQPYSHTGASRDMFALYETASELTYTGKDGKEYTTFRGFGHEHETNIRGNANDNDIYVVTNFKLTYVLGGSFKNARFR